MQRTVASPTAASLGRFGDIPISYFDGVPRISVPLFTAKGKTLELPIALAYHASGIKVEEIGGWVGAGWALEAGGVITRTVHGIVDEQSEGYFNTGHVFYEPANWAFLPPVTLVQNIHDAETIDGEPDQFFFNFAGFSGEFVGGDTSANGSLPNVYATIPYRKWRIEYQMGTDPFSLATVLAQWVITTENGTKYTFAAAEVHRDRTTQWLQVESGRDSKWYASSWYLTEIRAPGGDVITLNYASYIAEHHTGMYREEINDTYQMNPGDCRLSGYPGNSGSTIFDMHSHTYMNAKRLTSITSAAHTITFSTSLRQDATSPQNTWWAPGGQQQEPQLDLITVTTPADVVLRKFEFEYTNQGALGGRLTLVNVYEEDAGGTRLPPYTFTYDGPTLPARVTDRTNYHDPRTASFALDHWGYYNGADGNTTLIPPGTSGFATHNSYPGGDREPNFFFMKAGSLIKITYPTGGFNEFTYEANDYSWGAPLVGIPTPMNASTVSSPGDVVGSTKNFTIGGVEETVRVTANVFVDTPCSSSPCPNAELWDAAGTNWGNWSVSTASGGVVLPPLARGNYTIKTNNYGRPVRVAITISWEERVPVLSKTGAGLRIGQVRADDGMGNVTVRKYSYRLSDGRSSGWTTLGPKYDYNREVVSSNNAAQCSYYSRSSAPKIPLGSGPIVEYSVVTESLGVNGVFGSAVHRFDASCDCASAAAAQNQNRDWPFLRYTTATWRRGHPTFMDEFNATGQLQQSTSFTYSNPPLAHPTLTFRGLAVDVYSMWAVGTSSGIPANTYFIYANKFLVQTALKVETAESTTLYDETGTDSVVTSRQFTYGNPSHSQLTETSETNSDGTQRITRFKYPGDYSTNGTDAVGLALAAMQGSAHMPGAVIERTVISRLAGTELVVQSEITTFKQFGPGQFLPYQHFVLNNPTPLP